MRLTWPCRGHLAWGRVPAASPTHARRGEDGRQAAQRSCTQRAPAAWCAEQQAGLRGELGEAGPGTTTHLQPGSRVWEGVMVCRVRHAQAKHAWQCRTSRAARPVGEVLQATRPHSARRPCTAAHAPCLCGAAMGSQHTGICMHPACALLLGSSLQIPWCACLAPSISCSAHGTRLIARQPSLAPAMPTPCSQPGHNTTLATR
jgi:hypothetical protein